MKKNGKFMKLKINFQNLENYTISNFREDNINRNWKSLPGGKDLGRDNSMLSARGKKQAEECANRSENKKIQTFYENIFIIFR